jgi:hypothetical protein
MSLSFVGPKGGAEHRWIEFALLRDNVLHHLEGGTMGTAFPTLHRITDALGGKEVELNAAELNAELVRAKEALAQRPASELAISTRTRSVVERLWPIPPGAETALLSATPSSNLLTGREQVMGDVFGVLLDDLLRITEGAGPTQKLKVLDL